MTLQAILSVVKFCAALGVAAACGYIVLMVLGLVLMVPLAIICGAYSAIMTAFIMFIVVCQLTVSHLVKHLLNAFGIQRRERRENRMDSNQSHRQGSKNQRFAKSGSEQSFDPYEVLQVTRSADSREIKAAYLRQMSQYHPDKVAHLGADLRTLAEEKAKNIQQAYTDLAG